MDRITFLDQIYAGRTRLEALLERLPLAQMTTPLLPGGWTVKDLLAHLGWWEQRAVQACQESAAGQTPVIFLPDPEVDALNARIVEEYRPRGLDEVREFEQQAYHRLLAFVETLPEDELFDPQRFAWMEGLPLAEWIASNSSGHYDEHLEGLRGLVPGAEPVPGVVQRGVDFLAAAGRDIDRALVDYTFRRMPVLDVLDVLAHYQNADGGFTWLEVDIAAPVSNPFATELALRVLGWIDPPRDHPLVERVVAYLEQAQDEEGCWRFSPEVYQSALASWFQGWQWPNLNPSGQITGSLKRLGLGSDRLHARVQRLFDRLANPADLATGEYYSVLPYGLYFQTEWEFPGADLYRWGVAWWLVRQHVAGTGLDATHFLELAPRPDAPVAARLPQGVLAAKIDQLLAEQAADGGWPTPYDARWRPWVTANNLLILKAHGRI